MKWGVLALAYGVYFLLPWLRWEREVGVDQAVLFDLAGRKFYLFDLVVHPQDIFWLAGLLMIAAYLLFFVTGLAGRVFCGYFCFQTLWTDVYILIEHLIQGERPARIRLAKQAWDLTKLLKLATTHLLWLLMSFVTGLTFVLYWGDAPQLVRQFFAGEAPFAAYATTLFLTTTTYVMAGIARAASWSANHWAQRSCVVNHRVPPVVGGPSSTGNEPPALVLSGLNRRRSMG